MRLHHTAPHLITPYLTGTRGSGLGGRQGEQSQDVPVGTEVPLGAKKKQNGNAIFVTTQSPNRSMDAGKITKYMPLECPALKT